MSLGDHLAELRMRLIRSIIAVALGAAMILAFYDPVLRFLTRPYRDLCGNRPDFNCDGSLFALGPLDGLTARMKIAGYGGLVIALPIVLWQIWRFVVPALSKKEKEIHNSIYWLICDSLCRGLRTCILDTFESS